MIQGIEPLITPPVEKTRRNQKYPERAKEQKKLYRAANKENRAAYNKEYYQKNKAQQQARHKKWAQDHPDKMHTYAVQWRERNPNPPKARQLYLERTYGISLDDYTRMFEEQGGVCKLCKSTEYKKHSLTVTVQALSVDHCHATGKVRGLLCHNCNTALGKFKDNIEVLHAAITYLKEAE